MKRFAALFVLALAAPATAQERPWEWVDQGVEHFADGRYTQAGESFAAAALAAGEESAVPMYDQGCALLAEGRLDEAREALLAAASTREPGVAANARYNLGLVESAAVRELLGDDPGGAKGETRDQVRDGLAAAARRFRACLDLEPDREDARYNLELVRLYAKQLEDLWKQRDEAEKEDGEEPPENALQRLVRLMNEQEQLRDQSDGFEHLPADDERAEQLTAAREKQAALADELPDLRDQIATLFDPPETDPNDPSAAPPDPQQQQQREQAQAAIATLVQAAGESMNAAGEALAASDPSAAKALQARATDALEPVFRGIGNFESLVQEAVKLQQGLVDQTGARAEAAAAGTELDPAETVPDAPRASQRQQHVGGWAERLAPHAEQRLQQLEQAPPPGAAPPAPDPQAQAQAEAQRQRLKEALEKGRENGPEIARLAAEAVPLVAAEDHAAALPLQEEALRLLLEIAELLPQDENQPEQGDQNEDQDQEESEDQQDEQQNPQDPGEQPEGDEEQQQPEPRDLSREEAERLLQRAREREQDYKKKQEELKGLLGTAPVPRDW